MSIGEKLREARKSKHLTLREVGEKLDISFSNLAEIERGEHSCSADTLKILADFYGLSVDYFLGGNDVTQLSGVRLALYEGTKDLTDEQVQEIINFANFVKSKK